MGLPRVNVGFREMIQRPQSSRVKPPPAYRSPTLNGMTVAILVSWLFLNVVFVAFLSSGQPSGPKNPANQIISFDGAGRVWVAGVALGLAASFSWLATGFLDPLTRFSARFLASLPCISILAFFSTPDLLRHILNINGLILIQPFVFLVVGIPRWSISGRSQAAASEPPQRRQFHIGELIALTAVVAMLLAAGGRYTTPINSLAYWSVLVLCWFLLQSVAAMTIQITMYRRLYVLLLFLPLICLTAIGLTAAENFSTESRLPSGTYLIFYSLLLAGFTASVAITSLSGTPFPVIATSDSSTTDSSL